MKIIDRIIEIQEIVYENKVKHYELITEKKKEVTSFIGCVNKTLAEKIAKQKNLKIIKAKKITCPLNFKPLSISNNMILK